MSHHCFLLVLILVSLVTQSWSECSSLSPNSGPANIFIPILSGDFVFGTPFTPTSTITVSAMSISVQGPATANFILGIYDAATNTLLDQTLQIVMNNFAGGLIGANLIAPVTLVAGHPYYLVVGNSASFFLLVDFNFAGPYEMSSYNPLSLPLTITPLTENAVVIFTITSCPTVSGDPSFVGLLGQSYQVHGIDGEIYNLITDTNLQMNALFVFLNEGKCPILNNGHPASNCWSHPGSYLGEIGIQTISGGVLQQLSFSAGDRLKGFTSVEMNGRNLVIGDSFSVSGLTVHFNTSHLITVETDLFDYVFENSDMFINQVLNPNVPISKLNTHGLLGQTHSKKVYANAIKYVEGEVDDYIIQERQIFGSQFVFNKFQQSEQING